MCPVTALKNTSMLNTSVLNTSLPFLEGVARGSSGIRSAPCERKQRSGRRSWLLLRETPPESKHTFRREQNIPVSSRSRSRTPGVTRRLPELPEARSRSCEVGGCRTPPCTPTGADAGPESDPGPRSRRCPSPPAPGRPWDAEPRCLASPLSQLPCWNGRLWLVYPTVEYDPTRRALVVLLLFHL